MGTRLRAPEQGLTVNGTNTPVVGIATMLIPVYVR